MLMRIFNVSFVIIICVCVSFVHSVPYGYERHEHDQLQAGDVCFNKNKNAPGVCTKLQYCQDAFIELQVKKRLPQRCGFEGNHPIVCCVVKARSTESETTTSSTNSSRVPGEISKQKCMEYGKLAIKLLEIPTFDLRPVDTVPEPECPIQPTFVHGGEDALPKEFPHMALLGYGNNKPQLQWRCGGSLISEQFVLTAAHCTYERNVGAVKWVRLGDLDITSTDDVAATQDFDVIERIRHPGYKRPSTYHDIAVLKLDRRVIFDEFIRPACLHLTYETSPNGHFVVTGWGHLEHYDKENSPVLQKATIEQFTNAECRQGFEEHSGSNKLKDGVLDGSQICAGGKNNDRDTCPGDSGGPLQISHPDPKVFCMYSIVGVTSFGLPRCGVKGLPGIYTRVSNYIEWIENTVWPL